MTQNNMSDDKKISELSTLSPVDDNDYLVVVDRSDTTMSVDGTTKKALKTEMKGDQGDAATLDVGTTTTGLPGTDASVVNSGSTSAAIFDFTIPRGDKGEKGDKGDTGATGSTGATGASIISADFDGDDIKFTKDDTNTVVLEDAKIELKGEKGATGATGATGPAGADGLSCVWKGAWLTATGYDLQNIVENGGSSYVCVEAHTSGTFADDLTAGKWELCAQKGADGAGSGDVKGPASSTDNNIAVFDGITGKIIKDGGATLASKQDALGFTPENVANKKTDLTDNSDTYYPSQKAVKTAVDAKAPTASPTFTGTVTLPKTIEVQDTSADHQYVLAVNELTADRTVTLPLLTGNDEFTFNAHKQTLTNKRINPRLVTTTSYTTDTGTSLNIANCDQFEITAQAGALKFNNPGGTPVGGQKLIIRIKDNGTARALTYDTQFRAIGVTLPATTIASKTLYMGFIWNNTDSKWDCVAISQEA